MEGEDLASLFGSDLALFLKGCDRGHPDLRAEPFSSFLSGCDDILCAADFCSAEGLEKPLRILRSSAESFLPGLVPKVRTLREPFRTAARLKKSRVCIGLAGICEEAMAEGADLPRSFDHLRPGATDPAEMARWNSIASRFGAIGCESLSLAASRMAEDYGLVDAGFHRLPIRRAALIMCKALGLRHDSPVVVSVSPAAAASLPESCAEEIARSDRMMDGFAFFDHHVLLSAEGPDSVRIGYAVLGDRDGECYFLFSD